MKYLTQSDRNHAAKQLRFFMATVFLTSLLGLARFASAAPPANDNFGSAFIISSSILTNPITGSNLEATREPGEPTDVDWTPNPRSRLGSASVWWTFTPDTASDVTITTVGSSFDTQLGVYTGSSVSNLTEVASNEDAPGVKDGLSTVAFTTIPGTTYHILVNGYEGAQGSIKLNISGLNSLGGSPKPTVKILSPSNNQRVTDSALVVTGTAHSRNTNDPVAEVIVQLNDSATQIADGTTNWQANLPLTPGPNVIRVRSITQTGAESTEAMRNVTLVVLSPLTIQINGHGRVSPNLNGRNLEVTTVHRLRAIPDRDFLFTGWTGATNSTNAVIDFVMQENAVLIANFVADPFAAVRGDYNGLILTSNAITHASSGFFTVTVSRRDVFSGHFIVGGKRYSTHGHFDENGFANFALGHGALTGTLQLDMNYGTDQITGTLTDGVFNSTLLGDLDVFEMRTAPSPFAGRYNLNFLANDIVGGNGFATIRINSDGDLQLVGRLADGRVITQSVPVSKNGAWAFYIPLYGDKGSVISWMSFANLPSSSVSGMVNWFRPAHANDVFFPDGFATEVTAIGSLFIIPPPRTPMLNWVNGIAVLGGNNLNGTITNLVTFNSNNTITVNFQLASLHLTVNPLGILHGSFVHPMSQITESLWGAVLPKTNWAGGFFLDAPQSGFIFLGQDLSAGTNALIEPPGSLSGLTLNVSPATRTGSFHSFPVSSFTFTDGTFTTDVASFGTGTFNFSSYSTTAADVAELNLLGGTIHNRQAVIRVLLNFTSNSAGTFLAEITAGGEGVASGTFSIAP